MSVTLSEVKRAAKAHRAPLAGESAGYLVLAIADQVLSAPRMVQSSDVQLTEEGGLRVLSGRASSDADAELALRRALDSLLLVASSGSAALTRASRRTSPVGLSGLVRELEAALIPVNRSAARRALARLHRETARALTGGSLPEEDVEAALPMAAVAPVDVAPVARVPVATVPVATVPVATVPAATVPLAQQIAAAAIADVPEELSAPEESDALTVALEVKLLEPARPTAHVADVDFADFDVDVVLESEIEIEPEPLESESGAAPTVVHARVAPIPDLILAELPPPCESPVDMPVEACTRPEPVVLRKSLRSELTEVAPLVASEPCPGVSEPFSRTPTLGSLAAQLPVLAPEQIAELSAQAELAASAQAELAASAQAELAEAVQAEPVQQASAAHLEPDSSSVELLAPAFELEELEVTDESELLICSAPAEECTELTPEVAPLLPGVAIIASRRSDVCELLSTFQVAQAPVAEDSNQGFCRAIKELAGLDMTPAPFAALIR